MEPVIEVINIPNENSQEYVPIEFINDKDLSDTIMNAEITYAVNVLDQVGKRTSKFCIQKGLIILNYVKSKNKYEFKTNNLHNYLQTTSINLKVTMGIHFLI